MRILSILNGEKFMRIGIFLTVILTSTVIFAMENSTIENYDRLALRIALEFEFKISPRGEIGHFYLKSKKQRWDNFYRFFRALVILKKNLNENDYPKNLTPLHENHEQHTAVKNIMAFLRHSNELDDEMKWNGHKIRILEGAMTKLDWDKFVQQCDLIINSSIGIILQHRKEIKPYLQKAMRNNPEFLQFVTSR